MGLCYRIERKLSLPEEEQFKLQISKQNPLIQTQQLSIEPEYSCNDDPSQSNDDSSYYSSHYSKSSKLQDSQCESSYATSQYESCQINNKKNENEKQEKIQEKNQNDDLFFPIQVSEDNNEEIENISDDDSQEYSKASSYRTLTHQSRKSLKKLESKPEIVNKGEQSQENLCNQQSEEKIQRDQSKTLKSAMTGKSLKTFKSLDLDQQQQEDKMNNNFQKTIKTIAEQASKANQFLIVVTNETSTKDVKYMMVNMKESNMAEIKENVKEEEEQHIEEDAKRQVDEGQEMDKLDFDLMEIGEEEKLSKNEHPIISQNREGGYDDYQEIGYDTEQTIKTFESFYSTIKQRNTEKISENKMIPQKKSIFSQSPGKNIQ